MVPKQSLDFPNFLYMHGVGFGACLSWLQVYQATLKGPYNIVLENFA